MRTRRFRIRIGRKTPVTIKRKSDPIVIERIKKRHYLLPALVSSGILLMGAAIIGVYYLL